MRARRVGTGSEFRLFQDEQEIGHVDGTTVSFRGFDTPDDAALAASVAQRALARRRGEHRHSADGADDVIAVEDESMQVIGARHGVLATLLPPGPEDSPTGAWGFEIALLPSERFEVFALARARVIWRALQGTGIGRRMRQFAHGLTSV
jgi:hypothetical protein